MRYPDKPPSASDGKAFECLVAQLHKQFFDEEIGVFQDAERQLRIGESARGVECKHLQKAGDRIHIEIAERTSLRAQWVQSGIYRRDNTVRYVCGNECRVLAFDKRILQMWHGKGAPEEYWYGGDGTTDPKRATIQSVVLPLKIASVMMLYGFYFEDRRWLIKHQENRALARMAIRLNAVDIFVMHGRWW